SLDSADGAAARNVAEARDGWQLAEPGARGLRDGARDRVLACVPERAGEPQHLGRQAVLDEAHPPFGDGAGLVEDDRGDPAGLLEDLRPFDRSEELRSAPR